MADRMVITSLKTRGGPCGEVEVSLEQVSGKKAKLTCSKCKATRLFNLPGGRVDLAGFARMEEAVASLHQAEGDA